MLSTKSTSGQFWRSYRKKLIFFIFHVLQDLPNSYSQLHVKCRPVDIDLRCNALPIPISFSVIMWPQNIPGENPDQGTLFWSFCPLACPSPPALVCLFPLTHGHETDKWQWWRRPSPCAPPSCPPRACAQAAASPWFWWTQSPFPEHSEIRCWPKNASQHQTLVHSTPMFIFSTEKEKCEPRKPLNEDGNLNFAIEQLLLFCQSVPHTEVSVSKRMTSWSPY